MSKECVTHHHACDCREEKFKQLERENAALKQRILDDNKAYGCELMDPSGTIWDHAKRLQDENFALREDKERLDFLGQTKCAYYYEGPCCWRINEDKNTDGDTLRDAIDAARKEGP